jgi:valyl-tRNA synthetase
LEAYDFFWKEFCAYYLEIAKPTLFGKIGKPEEKKNKQKLLVIVLLHAIRLIHPMAPFITEELFQRLKERLTGVKVDKSKKLDVYTTEAINALSSIACIKAPYPQVLHSENEASKVDETFSFIESVVYTIRNIRGEMKIPSTTAVEVHIVIPEGHLHKQTITENLHIIPALIKVSSIQLHAIEPTHLEHASVGNVEGIKMMLPIPPELLEQEKTRLAKEKERLQLLIEKLSGQLSNESFVSNAPPELISKQRALLSQAQEDLQQYKP